MCIISICPKGTLKDSKKVWDFVEEGFSNNKQGSGYMFKRNGESTITIDKGYFKLENLIDSIKRRKLKVDDELVIHHRISTAGKITRENCHPFVISTKANEVSATDIVIKKPCLAHNGVFRYIHDYTKLNDDFSDTYAFCRYVLSNKGMMSVFRNDKDLFKVALKDILHNSRFVILSPDKDLETFGLFYDDEGYQHSNTGYFKKVTDVGGSSWSEGFNNRQFERLTFGSNYRRNPESMHDDMYDENTKKFIEETNNMLLKKAGKPIVKFDDDDITLTQDNISHFYYMDKLSYTNNYFDRKYELNNFDKEAFNHILKVFDKNPPILKNICIATHRLIYDHYYIPKNDDYKQIYLDFMILKNSNVEIGAKTIRSLDKILTKSNRKEASDFIFYEKMDEKFTKMSLYLYRQYLLGNTYAKNVKARTFNDVENPLKAIVDKLDEIKIDSYVN